LKVEPSHFEGQSSVLEVQRSSNKAQPSASSNSRLFNAVEASRLPR
jgi:hypothetical protein